MTLQTSFDFDGLSYDAPRDRARLNAQLSAVLEAMKDGNWRTLHRIHMMTGAPTPSISARLRDLRKPRFGARTIERRYVERGLFEYRLVPKVTTNG